MARLDLTSAYLHVPIHPHDRDHLSFFWNGVRYRYRSMPFGLSVAPRVFTKIMKPIVANLRSQGIRLVIYL
ncbi:reverse transcriptase domain-containing protein, partial [Acinetobacter baumannii]